VIKDLKNFFELKIKEKIPFEIELNSDFFRNFFSTTLNFDMRKISIKTPGKR
jgi:hypothetical protein